MRSAAYGIGNLLAYDIPNSGNSSVAIFHAAMIRGRISYLEGDFREEKRAADRAALLAEDLTGASD
ncbi:hypothetical protein HYPDE_37013 [Hyphomicrobium denitrificans 1NES1]|uniref:Uncharacterized protein n=1 Tax=Hyphomicrobium denitrificans 1NES1 TaxID=670307 RepID=N0B680_9HYPH|nr:hypothetical protein HYPDE_37013 [Hyphomicrobium denitrificans 1NES1]